MPITTTVKYNNMKPASASSSDQAIAHLTNAVSRPGPLTTEWWTVLIATLLSTVLGVVGVTSNTATQIAATAAPIVLALAYAFTRAHTKSALATALSAIFPQASTNPPGGSSDQTSEQTDPSPELAGANGKH
jgi:hypothetical protein